MGKVALEGGNTVLLIACPASSLHYRPAQLPLCLSAPGKCTHLLLRETLLMCTSRTCCNHILGRNQCAPSAYLIPSTSSVFCSEMLRPRVCSCLGACHAKAGKDRLLPSGVSDHSGGRQSVSGKKLTHFDGESGTKSCGTYTSHRSHASPHSGSVPQGSVFTCSNFCVVVMWAVHVSMPECSGQLTGRCINKQ